MRVKVLGMGLLAGLFALLVAGPVANAATMTTAPETEFFTLTAPQVTYTVTNEEFSDEPATVIANSPQTISQALTFTQFDGGLGTLTGVTITFSSVYGATAVVAVPVNGDEETISFFSDASVNHLLTNPALIVPASELQQFNATCTAPSGEPCPDTPVSNTPPDVVFDSPLSGLSLAPGALGSFVGAGTYDLTATLNSVLAPRIVPDNTTGFADNTTFSGTLDATWDGSVSVVYTYQTAETSVPGPLSLYLVAAGLGGLALLRRYRR